MIEIAVADAAGGTASYGSGARHVNVFFDFAGPGLYYYRRPGSD